MADVAQQGASNLPPGSPPVNHGKTPAAWTTFLLVTIGSLVSSVGLVLGSVAIAVAGGVVIIGGLVVGKVMQAMGLGQPPGVTPPQKPASHG